VINFMSNCFLFNSINYFFYFEIMFFPTMFFMKRVSYSLSNCGFSATTSNHFFNRKLDIHTYFFNIFYSLWHIHC